MTHRHDNDGGSERDRDAKQRHLRYEIGENESRSEAVVKAVATSTDTEVLDLAPLHEAINPESIDEAFETVRGDAAGTVISFLFEGCEVTVRREEVHVRAIENC